MIVQTPRVVCDRPSCHRTVTTDNGSIMKTPTIDGGEERDLCSECRKSLESWWTAKARRAANESAGNTEDGDG